MISHGVEISIAGRGADEKDEGNRRLLFFSFFSPFFIIKYSLLRYKILHAALAMAETKPQNNPTARFTWSWDKQIPPTRRNEIKHEDQKHYSQDPMVWA